MVYAESGEDSSKESGGENGTVPAMCMGNLQLRGEQKAAANNRKKLVSRKGGGGIQRE